MLEHDPQVLPREKFTPFRLYTEQERKISRLKRRAFSTFVITVLVLVSATYIYFYYHSFFESTKDVQLFTQSAPLQSKVGGKVAKVLVKESQVVKAGDPLVQLDAREYQANLEQLERTLQRSEDQLAGGQAHLARLREKLDESNEAARQQYEGSRAWLGRLQVKTQEQRQAVAEARAQLDAATIKAPADGHIGPISVQAGATIAPGQPLLNFVGAGMPWLVANFKEIQFEKIKAGQQVSITILSLNRTYSGQIESIPTDEVKAVDAKAHARSDIERILMRYFETGKRIPVRINFDATSVGKEKSLLVSGAPTEVKVYVK